MSVLNQKTINQDITFNGIGLHSGLAVTMTVKPAAPNTGIIFKRIKQLYLKDAESLKR